MAVNPQDVAEAMEVLNRAETGINLDEMIAAARLELIGGTGESTEADKITAPDPIKINELVALQQKLKDDADHALKEREKIKTLLSEYTATLRFGNVEAIADGSKTELQVNGSTVFTLDSRKSRVFNAGEAKKEHPDIPGNERFWLDKFTVFREFK